MTRTAPIEPHASRLGRRGWILAGAVVVFDVMLAGYVAAGAIAYDQLSRVPAQCEGLTDQAQTPADFGPSDDTPADLDLAPYHFSTFEEVAFPSRDANLTIRGWYTAPRAADGPVVLLVHGWKGCRQATKILLPAAMLHRAGFGVLMIDLRNHGTSDSDGGRWAGGAKEYRDVLGAWDWLVATGHDPARIGLFGISLGAATVTMATGEEPRIAATWADSSYADFQTAAEDFAASHGYPRWVVGSAVPVGRFMSDPELGTRDPADEVRKLDGRPFFITHGLSDTTILPHHAVDLAAAAAAGGTAVLPWLVAGAGHVQAMFLQPARYEELLYRFFASTIGAP